MVSYLATLWVAVSLGQAPAPSAEAAWLSAVPAEAEVVVRVRGIRPARDDLVKMIEAMSPRAAEAVKPALEQQLDALLKDKVKDAFDSDGPVMLVARLPEAGAAGGPPPFVALVRASNFDALRKAVANANGGQAQFNKLGYYVIRPANGPNVYTCEGKGFVAVGSSEELIAAIARPKGSLDKTLDADLRARLLGGDVGIYVNLGAVQARYGDQIDQARKGFMAAMDQAGAQMGDEAKDAMKSMYGGMFDALKTAEALALNFDFAADGLVLAGEVAVKPDAARSASGAKPGTGEEIGKLPADAAYYVYSNIDPDAYEKLQALGMSFMFGPGKKGSPELQKAMDLQREARVREVYGASSMAKGGMRGINVVTYDDPQKAVEATTALMKAMNSNKSGAMNFIKDVQVDPEAEKYEGFTFSRIKSTFDMDKLAKFPGAVPGGKNPMVAMIGESITTWIGTDGKVVIAVVAPDWDQAKAQIDAVRNDKGTIGQTAGYRAIRSKLPREVNGLFLMSAQGMVRQLSIQFAAMFPDNAQRKPPADMPKEPALLGVALTRAGKGYQFQLVVPSAVGPVFEKGMIPLFQGLPGQPAKVDQ